MKRQILIAAAAKVPLYLPLYIARHYNFFGLLDQYDVGIEEPQANVTNRDSWATEQLNDTDSIWFAVCDPTYAEHDNLRVVATIVSKAAFWAVSKKPAINDIGEFADFDRLLTYPEGMTARQLSRFIVSCFPKKKIEITEAKFGKELNDLLDYDDKTVALTADPLYLRRFMREHRNKGYRVSSPWMHNPILENFMLTGLLTREEIAVKHYQDVARMIDALNRAAAMIAVRESIAAEVLFREQDPSEHNDTLKADVLDLVREFRRNRFFPISPFPDMTGWHHAYLVHHKPQVVADLFRQGQSAARRLARSNSGHYGSRLNSLAAGSVEENVLRRVATFSQAELHQELITKLKNLERLNISKLVVVGDYLRAGEVDRNELRDRVARMRSYLSGDALLTNFLIWAEPGYGKSFLIEEFGRSLERDGSATFRKVDLAKSEIAVVVDQLKSLPLETRPTLCLVDEVDSWVSTPDKYAGIYGHFRVENLMNPVVCALVGSTERGLEGMVSRLQQAEKAKDLIDRISETRRFVIPRLTTDDKIAVIAHHLTKPFPDKPRRRLEIAKMVFYYILASKQEQSMRQLSDLAKETGRRVSASETQVRYELLFDQKDSGQHDFWAEHRLAADELNNRFLVVED